MSGNFIGVTIASEIKNKWLELNLKATRTYYQLSKHYKGSGFKTRVLNWENDVS